MKKTIFIITFIFITIICTQVRAVGAVDLNASKSAVNPDETFTITANLNGASAATLTIKIGIDTSKVEYVSGPSNSSFSNGRVIYTWTDSSGGENPKNGGIATFTFKAKSVGIANFNISGDLYDANEVAINPSFSGTSVTIENPETPPSPETPTTEPTTPIVSEQPTTPVTPQEPTQPNEPSITLSSNTNLKTLYLDVEGINPQFSKNTRNYYLVVGDMVSSIKVTALAEDSKARVSITGNTDLAEGANKINITVTAENGEKKLYTVNVTKTTNPDLANANLENLAIENVILSPEFNPDILDYRADLPSSTTTIGMLAVPQIEGASVDISSKETINFGSNIITITVTAKDQITQKIYAVDAYRKTEEEEAKETLANLEIISSPEITQNSARSKSFGEIVLVTIIILGALGLIYMITIKYLKEINSRR